MVRFTVVFTALCFSIGLIAADKDAKAPASDKDGKDKTIKSGIGKGQSCSAFQVEDVTGPSKGKQLCYVCQNGAKPVALIFTKEVDKGLTDLVKEIEKATEGTKDATGFVVLLTDDKKAGHQKLETVAKENHLKLPLTINADGKKAPESYQVNESVKHTILIYKDKKVIENYALNEISSEKVKEIAGAAKKVFKN